MSAPTLPTTSYALLGLLAFGPMSGYDLTAFAARSIANFWPIQKSQVYGELDRLEGLGYLEATEVAQEGLPDKRIFAPTAEGDQALDAWLQQPGYQRERRRNAFLVKVFFGWRMPPERFEALLDDYQAETRAERDRLQAIVDRLAPIPSAAFGRATAQFGLRHAEATLAWCEQMRAALPHLRRQVARSGRAPAKDVVAASTP